MLVSIINDQGIGGIFLDWSLHYLAGHKNYYSLKFNKVLPVPDNVFESDGFTPPTIFPKELFDLCYTNIKNIRIENFNTLAIGPLRSTPYTDSNTKESFAFLQNNSEKTVVLYVAENYHRLCLAYEHKTLGGKFNSLDILNKDYKDQWDDYIDTFFLTAKNIWGKENLVDVWDRREFLALTLRPYLADDSVLDNIELDKTHYGLEVFELFNNFDKTVKDLFKFLDIKIDQSRWEDWLKVYAQLQNRVYDRVLFAEYFECIIESIINNYYLDLTRFKLDIIREAVIQHELLYKHGLTIKGWGLEKFPNNTRDLHKLLEKNTYHTIENIYGAL